MHACALGQGYMDGIAQDYRLCRQLNRHIGRFGKTGPGAGSRAGKRRHPSAVAKYARKAGLPTIAVSCIYIVAGCSQIAESTPDRKASAPEFGSEYEYDIGRLVYESSYTVPAGFLIDSRADTPGSYTIHHVKDESTSFEVCTNDRQQAATLESIDNTSRSVSGVLVETFENEMFYEFVRNLEYPAGVGNAPGETVPGFSRVFKCSYVDRSGVDRNLRDGYGGQLNVVPLDAINAKAFVEYLWQFAFFWPAQTKVISSQTVESVGSIRHTLSLAFVYSQGVELCDRIEIVDWTFSISRSDGLVSKSFTPVHVFEAENVNGSVRVCVGGQAKDAN